jgi:general secretion pathway protein G
MFLPGIVRAATFGLILCVQLFLTKLTKMQNVSRTLQRGFTLIEIMVVVVIIGILGALVVPKLMGKPGEARITAARVDISTLMQALKLYKLDNQRYPTTEQGLRSLVEKPSSGPSANGWKTGGYIDKLPKDPWGNPYQYLAPGVKGEVDLFSLGADGLPGGVGDDADVGSWD